MFILAHTQSVPRRPQSVTPTAWIGTILASCPGSFPYTLGLDTQPATLYQQLHQPSLQSCQVPAVNYAARGMSLLETSSLNCSNRVSLASLHISGSPVLVKMTKVKKELKVMEVKTRLI